VPGAASGKAQVWMLQSGSGEFRGAGLVGAWRGGGRRELRGGGFGRCEGER
jgi:hypothetical protein